MNQNQGWEPIQQKYKANKNTSRHNPKEKTKVNNQQMSYKDPMQRQLMAMKWQQQRRLQMKELLFATNWLVMEVH